MKPVAVALALLVLLASSACGSGNGAAEGEEPAADTSATTTAAPTTTEAEPESTLPETPKTPLTTSLDQGYKVVGGQQEAFEASELPIEPDSVEARWFRSGPSYVVAYAGLSLDDAGALCPGNSAQIGAAFEHISNSPTSEGACKGAPKLAGAGAGVRECGPLLVYVTEIPADTSGILYASVERYEGSTITGVTGSVSTNLGEAPMVELGELGC